MRVCSLSNSSFVKKTPPNADACARATTLFFLPGSISAFLFGYFFFLMALALCLQEFECDLLRNMGIMNLHELWVAIKTHRAFKKDTQPSAIARHVVLYKRHIVTFMNRWVKRARFDFNTLNLHQLAQKGGTYPDQWIALKEPLFKVDYNAGFTDQDAIAEAFRRSIQTCECPDSFFCSLSHRICVTPMRTTSGKLYDEQFLAESLENGVVIPDAHTAVLDQGLRHEIREWWNSSTVEV